MFNTKIIADRLRIKVQQRGHKCLNSLIILLTIDD